MRIGIISDTHIPMRGKALPNAVASFFSGVDTILHAGDVVTGVVLDELSALAPVHAVLGNCDPWNLGLPESLEIELGGIRVGMIHDSGSTQGRRHRMRRMFPRCRVVVFGHSHQPLIEDDEGLMLINPGSACDPRAANIPTVALIEIDGGQLRAWHETVTR